MKLKYSFLSYLLTVLDNLNQINSLVIQNYAQWHKITSPQVFSNFKDGLEKIETMTEIVKIIRIKVLKY